MSDKSLFKNADAQEAAYAPEGSDHDRSERDADDVSGSAVVIPAAGLATAGVGGLGGTGGPGGMPAAGPAVAGAALAGDLLPDGDGANRDLPDGVNDATG